MDINCEDCVYFVYDENDDFYECMMQIDEDESVRMMYNKKSGCPYFRLDDEYSIVRKQN